jgi:hypothetical protein
MAEAYPDRYTTKAGVFLIGIQLRTGPRCRLHPDPATSPWGTPEGAHQAGTHAHPAPAAR